MSEQHQALREHPQLFHLTGNVFAEVAKWQGRKYLDIRKWWTVTENGVSKWARTSKGFRVEVEDFEQFASTLPQLVEWASKQFAPVGGV